VPAVGGNPSRVVSLLDMLDFAASDYIQLTYSLGQIIGNINKKLPNPSEIKEQFKKWMEETARLNLPATRAHLNKMISELAGSGAIAKANLQPDSDGFIQIEFEITDANLQRFCHHLEAAYTTLNAELAAISFVAIPREHVRYYSAEPLFGPKVFEQFPRVIYDIGEAGKCLALGRGTACVFHLMRIMEEGLKILARGLGIPYAPSWESYLTQIKTKIEEKHKNKTPKWKRTEPFYKEVLGDLQMVKIAWRNPTMHIVRKYTPEEAEGILGAVGTMMQKLAVEPSLWPRKKAKGS
jgi:hypothetical protein